MLVSPCGAMQGYCVELLAGCRYQRSLKATIDVSWVERAGAPRLAIQLGAPDSIGLPAQTFK